jgi:hypothetical protein
MQPQPGLRHHVHTGRAQALLTRLQDLSRAPAQYCEVLHTAAAESYRCADVVTACARKVLKRRCKRMHAEHADGRRLNPDLLLEDARVVFNAHSCRTNAWFTVDEPRRTICVFCVNLPLSALNAFLAAVSPDAAAPASHGSAFRPGVTPCVRTSARSRRVDTACPASHPPTQSASRGDRTACRPER